ncbi:MAG: UPF0261 family protein [Streptosporangiales bacterium]|nr:UPF0261 family protein [Streptosporangiales bacterium]
MTQDRPPIAVLATADTKGAEAAFLRDELRRRGWPVRVVDVGLTSADEWSTHPDLAGEWPIHPDVPAEQVARAAGQRLAQLRDRARRDEAMAAMAEGAGRLLADWYRRGDLAGAVGLGGNQGTAITAGAMRELPLGVPKLVVSTVASGDIRGFIADSDIAVLFSVGDLLGGPNPVTARVLRQAAGAVAGMAEALAPDARESPAARGPVVAVTAFGNTHAAVTAAMERLAGAGVETVPFHASGASGSAMERLIDEGTFVGVLDLTTHELLGELYPADIYAPVRPGRLTAAGRRGVPQVVAPGGLEYHCFAAADTIPAALRARPTHHHNANNTNVRASAEELVAVAEEMARRLGTAAGPVAVLIPRRGWSEVGSPGGVLHDPAANAAFVDALRRALPPRVALRELDSTINDPAFAAAAAETMLDFLSSEGVADEPGTGTRDRDGHRAGDGRGGTGDDARRGPVRAR